MQRLPPGNSLMLLARCFPVWMARLRLPGESGNATKARLRCQPRRGCRRAPGRSLSDKFSLLSSFLAQRQSGKFFKSRQRGLAFGGVLPVLLVQVENVEKRGQQRLEVLTVVLIGGDARLKSGSGLRNQALFVNS